MSLNEAVSNVNRAALALIYVVNKEVMSSAVASPVSDIQVDTITQERRGDGQTSAVIKFGVRSEQRPTNCPMDENA